MSKLSSINCLLSHRSNIDIAPTKTRDNRQTNTENYNMDPTFGLIACSKTKRGKSEQDRKFKANRLYDSWLFNRRMNAVKEHCEEYRHVCQARAANARRQSELVRQRDFRVVYRRKKNS